MKTDADRLNFYKELYFKEIDKRQGLNNSISVPITLIAGSFSVLFYLATQWKPSVVHGTVAILFLVSIVLAFVCTLISVYFVVKFYSNSNAGYVTIELAKANEMEEYYKSLEKHHDGDKEKANIDFTQWLISELVTCTAAYQVANDKKSTDFFGFKKAIFYTLIWIVIATLVFCLNIIQLNSTL
ncbi:hypothetical protein SAMN06298216_1709 [Spirosomataceae bacterium TFI 002]|nr:hypothetical protein SAMN06298216_1709 [Spirosomataceae bacterium TFI 002]